METNDEVTRPGGWRLREGEDKDLTRSESVAAAIRKAFPLPPSGAFSDLLAAIDEAS